MTHTKEITFKSNIKHVPIDPVSFFENIVNGGDEYVTSENTITINLDRTAGWDHLNNYKVSYVSTGGWTLGKIICYGYKTVDKISCELEESKSFEGLCFHGLQINGNEVTLITDS